MQKLKIQLANPRGFCAGVDRAISVVENALHLYQEQTIYVRHEVVHNRFVVDDLKQRGVIFVEQLSEVPDKQIVIFSAHGVSQAVRQEAKRRQLTIFDATCPLVTKVHMEVARASKKGIEVILIGHAGHPEVEGTTGQYTAEEGGIYLVQSQADVAQLEVKDASKLQYASQTTLSVDETTDIIAALKEKFPQIKGPRKDDICYATQNRQDAVRELAKACDCVIVVGSPNSSNSTRLKELAEKMGTKSYLIDAVSAVDQQWFVGCHQVGITAGASAPEVLVQSIIDEIKAHNDCEIEECEGIEEDLFFEVPRELRVQTIE